ncbi:MAG: MFS transporter [Deltaproteobacteria bacterium]|nr:MFS transporter [Deltaproteobacteria bacterium]
MKHFNKNILKKPHIWCFSTYFAEGFPYTIIRIISSVFFRDMKANLEAVGLTSLFGLPWVLKFLWGPQVDQYGTKKKWMTLMQFFLALLFISVAFLVPIHGGIKVIALLFFIGSIIAATNDIAIDGYYMEALDKNGQAKFVGYRTMAYRISMMTGTGIIVTISAMTSWMIGFLVAGLLLLLLFFYHFFLLPEVEKQKYSITEIIKNSFRIKPLLVVFILIICTVFIRWIFSCSFFQGLEEKVPVIKRISISGWIGIALLLALTLLAILKNKISRILINNENSFYSRAFISYIDREKIGVILTFIILLRTGEFMLSSMSSAFMVDLGLKIHYGWISGAIGLPFSIIGAITGGWAISKYSLKRTLWPFLLAQNITNLIYMLLALFLNNYLTINTGAENTVSIGNFNLFLVASVNGFDQFAGGLGTSVLMTYLMRTCLPEFKAAHYAIGSGLMNICGVLSGVVSGFLAEWLGYSLFFGISFLASVPGMIMIFFIPLLEAEETIHK